MVLLFQIGTDLGNAFDELVFLEIDRSRTACKSAAARLDELQALVDASGTELIDQHLTQLEYMTQKHAVLTMLLDAHGLVIGGPTLGKRPSEVITCFEGIAGGLDAMRSIAAKGGDLAPLLYADVTAQERFVRGLRSLARPDARTRELLSGVVTLFALVVLLVVVQLTVRPDVASALVLFAPEAVVALIVGFGTTAVYFRPLLTYLSPKAAAKD
ncbi:MAG: hypothetical protein ACXWCM_06830 [Acidimicrobiales bacterium]